MPATRPDRTARKSTRERLLLASLQTFGRHDYDAVGTRQIVELADANISAISYHFGSKQELYLATAEYLATSIRGNLETTAAGIRKRLDHASAGTCIDLISELVSALATDVLQGELSDDAAGFIFREQLQPTVAFDSLYRELIEPMHTLFGRLLCCAWQRDAEDREIRLMTHALLGQILIFRLGQATILRRLGSDGYAADDVDQITDRIVANTLAAIDTRRNGGHRHD
jgi:AcrR family transcriptional regulator